MDLGIQILLNLIEIAVDIKIPINYKSHKLKFSKVQ